MDYSKLSDQEINMAVAEIFHPDSVVIESKSRPPSACITGHLPSLWVDYCNNPADAWPIISANRITIEYDAEHQCDVPVEWVTAYGIDGLKVHLVAHQPCDKALRSAMIVFLMMQESANVPANSTGSDLR